MGLWIVEGGYGIYRKEVILNCNHTKRRTLTHEGNAMTQQESQVKAGQRRKTDFDAMFKFLEENGVDEVCRPRQKGQSHECTIARRASQERVHEIASMLVKHGFRFSELRATWRSHQLEVAPKYPVKTEPLRFLSF